MIIEELYHSQYSLHVLESYKMFYWCNLSPPQMFWSWLQDIDELVLIAGGKGNKNKEVGSNLWRWSSLSPLFATGDVSSEAKANFIKTWGMGRLTVARSHYIIIDFMCVSQKRNRMIDTSSCRRSYQHGPPGWVKWNSALMTAPLTSQRWGNVSGSRCLCGQ